MIGYAALLFFLIVVTLRTSRHTAVLGCAFTTGQCLLAVLALQIAVSDSKAHFMGATIYNRYPTSCLRCLFRQIAVLFSLQSHRREQTRGSMLNLFVWLKGQSMRLTPTFIVEPFFLGR